MHELTVMAMNTSAGRTLLSAACVLLAYFVMYAVSVQRTPMKMSLMHAEEFMPADYRYVGESGAWFFWPAHQLDRLVRPGHWRIMDP